MNGGIIMESVIRRYEDLLKDKDIAGFSYTLSAINTLKPVLGHLRDKGIRILMDLGCGYGVLSLIIADFIGA